MARITACTFTLISYARAEPLPKRVFHVKEIPYIECGENKFNVDGPTKTAGVLAESLLFSITIIARGTFSFQNESYLSIKGMSMYLFGEGNRPQNPPKLCRSFSAGHFTRHQWPSIERVNITNLPLKLDNP